MLYSSGGFQGQKLVGDDGHVPGNDTQFAREEPAEGTVERWDVVLEREAGTSAGLEVRKHGWARPYVSVAAILPGELLSRWNEANPRTAVQLDDRVLSINGMSGNPHKIVAELVKQCDRMVLTIERPVLAPIKPSPDAAHQWNVFIEREAGTATGLDIKKHEWKQPYVSVAKIQPGELVSRWNAGNPNAAVQAGDRIVAVNGIGEDPHKIVAELLKQSDTMVLLMERASPNARWDVSLEREPGTATGLDIKTHQLKESYVSVAKIEPGMPVSNWNAANPNAAIQVEDRIVAVNGIGGDPKKIIDELVQPSTKLVLSLERPQ